MQGQQIMKYLVSVKTSTSKIYCVLRMFGAYVVLVTAFKLSDITSG